ncbi:MAG TPA: hypothetical protein VG323_07175 [Thermoanaerobaculia bacterium]|nr:hypothetical protein [Thermoanaerobaculia bacterium]
MKKSTTLIVAVVVALALSLSVVSAAVPQPASHAIPAATEAKLRGGLSCDAALGLGAGLAIGALTPCSIVCAVGAWYDLALIAYEC